MRLADSNVASDHEWTLAVPWVCELGESPLWHPLDQRLYWVDIAARRIHRHDARTGAVDHWSCATEPACLAPALDGGLLVARRDGLWYLDTRRGEEKRLCKPPYDPRVERFNDGKVDAQGHWWISTIYEPRDRPAAALYRYDGQVLEKVADGVTNGNGLAFSADGQRLWWADTSAHRIDTFLYAAGAATSSSGSLSAGALRSSMVLSGRRPFAQFTRPADAGGQVYGGRPDGAAVDSQGRYWVAMYEGSRLLCFSDKGEVLDELALPVQCPTMPCFGGPDLRTLYVTTARHGRPAAELAAQPLAGALLSLRVRDPGQPAHVAGAWSACSA